MHKREQINNMNNNGRKTHPKSVLRQAQVPTDHRSCMNDHMFSIFVGAAGLIGLTTNITASLYTLFTPKGVLMKDANATNQWKASLIIIEHLPSYLFFACYPII